MRSVFTNGDAMMRISDLKFSYPDGGFHLEVDKLRIDAGTVTTNGMDVSSLEDRAGDLPRMVGIGESVAATSTT